MEGESEVGGGSGDGTCGEGEPENGRTNLTAGEHDQ